ncbi:MAG: hypothetical protein ACE5ID_06735 [Acidobacteriota bacterium]
MMNCQVTEDPPDEIQIEPNQIWNTPIAFSRFFFDTHGEPWVGANFEDRVFLPSVSGTWTPLPGEDDPETITASTDRVVIAGHAGGTLNNESDFIVSIFDRSASIISSFYIRSHATYLAGVFIDSASNIWINEPENPDGIIALYNPRGVFVRSI